jgi:hypothetical protein
MAHGTASATVARPGVTVVLMAIGGTVTVVGSLLPWVRTGSRQRNSYDVFALVRRLGFSPDGPAANGLRWWPLVPLLVAVAVVVAWWGWRRPGGVVGVIAAIYAGGIGVAVATADTAAVVEVRAGPGVTAVGAAVLLAGAVATLIVNRPGRPTGPAR